MRARPKAFLILFVVALIWGLASVVIKATLDGIEPVSFLVYRFGISSLLALFSYKKIFALRKKPLETKGMVLLYSLISTPVALGLLFVGMTQSSVLTLAVFTAMGPIILSVAGHIFFHEHLTHTQKIGAAIAFVGSLVSIAPEFFHHEGVGTLFGSILIFLYILVDAASVLVLKKLLRAGIDGTTLTHLSFISGFVCLLPFLLLTNKGFFTSLPTLPASIHLGVFYMAVLSGTVAFALRAKAQKTIGLSEAGFMGYLVPILSTLFAVLFLSEAITKEFAIGAIIITVGVFLIEYHKPHKKPTRS